MMAWNISRTRTIAAPTPKTAPLSRLCLSVVCASAARKSAVSSPSRITVTKAIAAKASACPFPMDGQNLKQQRYNRASRQGQQSAQPDVNFGSSLIFES